MDVWEAGDKKPCTREIHKLLNAPAGCRLIAMIAVGYAAAPVARRGKKPILGALHWEIF